METGTFSMDPATIAFFLLVASVVALAGALFTALLTRPLMGWLASRQMGKAIREDGPDHAAKSGTPTMGGIGMLVTAGLSIILSVRWLQSMFSDPADGLPPAGMPSFVRSLGIVFLGTALFAAIGLVDDLQGLARKSGRKELGVGLKARHMSLLQWLAAFGLSAGLLATGGLVLPGSWPTLAGLLLTSFVIVGCVNGVNLSDGLDGLAAGLIGIAFAALAILSAGRTNAPGERWSGDSSGTLNDYFYMFAGSSISLIALATAGACLGFLFFNRHPARVFMGNVASMGLGALLALLSLLSGFWILLPIFGAVFVAEVLSVILQVGYFKYSGGERIFRMAPFHHHFELGGMHEVRIVRRFWAAGLVSALAAIAMAGPVLERFSILLPSFR